MPQREQPNYRIRFRRPGQAEDEEIEVRSDFCLWAEDVGPNAEDWSEGPFTSVAAGKMRLKFANGRLLSISVLA